MPLVSAQKCPPFFGIAQQRGMDEIPGASLHCHGNHSIRIIAPTVSELGKQAGLISLG